MEECEDICHITVTARADGKILLLAVHNTGSAIAPAAGDKVCNPNAQSIWVEVDGRHYEIPAGKTVALV